MGTELRGTGKKSGWLRCQEFRRWAKWFTACARQARVPWSLDPGEPAIPVLGNTPTRTGLQALQAPAAAHIQVATPPPHLTYITQPMGGVAVGVGKCAPPPRSASAPPHIVWGGAVYGGSETGSLGTGWMDYVSEGLNGALAVKELQAGFPPDAIGGPRRWG
jgi:hypothetical protein